jgi:hypothetical protein
VGNRGRFNRVRRVALSETANRYAMHLGEASSRPLLRLCGRWLADAGFQAGQQVQVEVGPDVLVIRPASTIKVPF